jgi:Putative MetA-pathway of phenol degradation
MSNRRRQLRTGLFSVLLPLATTLGGHATFASDPLPGDSVAPPPNINIGIFYNEFNTAGEVGAVHGDSDSKNTHISTNILVGRYIRTFDVGGFLSGVQVYVPYATFLGGQEAGVANIPSVAPGLLPAFGPGSANLSHESGFGQPNFGAFSFLVNKPETGTYFVVGPWISPPVSSFNKNANLNPAQNVWVYEAEAGLRTVLIGTPATRNLSIEIWGEAYLFGSNDNSALTTPEVSANNIPPIFSFEHMLDPLIPAANPLQAAAATPASFHEQPSEEFRIYLPYEFLPHMHAFITPGFFQSFGGKQTYTLRDDETVDSGNRTNETQLRLVASTFLSPTSQVMVVGDYDVAAHGDPLNRTVELRLLKFF